MRQFNKDIAADPRVIATLVPLSYGLTFCVKSVNLEGEALAAALKARKERSDEEPLLELLRARQEVLRNELAALNDAETNDNAADSTTVELPPPPPPPPPAKKRDMSLLGFQPK